MMIAILSDIHDNQPNLEKCLAWCKQNKVESIICCGDITTYETASIFSKNFTGEIYTVEGNAEIYTEAELTKLKNITYCGEIGIKEFPGANIAFCHEPEKIKKINELTPLDLDFIFYGHTHKPWLEKKGETIIANPGTVAGVFSQATFAVLDTEKKNLALKVIADL